MRNEEIKTRAEVDLDVIDIRDAKRLTYCPRKVAFENMAVAT